jgi:nitrogen fixation/metabolism regulation signal transduction histidine kinase
VWGVVVVVVVVVMMMMMMMAMMMMMMMMTTTTMMMMMTTTTMMMMMTMVVVVGSSMFRTAHEQRAQLFIARNINSDIGTRTGFFTIGNTAPSFSGDNALDNSVEDIVPET